jgi:uncharacterized protein (TIGR02118 family)
MMSANLAPSTVSAAPSFWAAAHRMASGPDSRSKFGQENPGQAKAWRSDTGVLLPMVKLMVTARRRPDISIDHFHDYWLNRHGPLTAELAPVLRVQRYVQNHSFDSEAGRMFLGGRDADEASFDGLAEGWWRSERDMIEAFSSPEGQEASRRLAEDERNFCSSDNQILVAYEYEFVSIPLDAAALQ